MSVRGETTIQCHLMLVSPDERLCVVAEKRMEELKRKKEEIQKQMDSDADNLSKEERDKMIEQHEAKLRQLEQDEQSKKAAMDRSFPGVPSPALITGPFTRAVSGPFTSAAYACRTSHVR